MRLSIFVFGFLLMGCASVTPAQSTIQTTTTTFSIVEHILERGSIAVQSVDPVLNKSLEFDHYRPLFEQQLALQGYTIESDPKKAQYLALISYGVDRGQVEILSTPFYRPMWDGGLLFPHHGFGHHGHFVSFGYGMPGLNVMGATSTQVTRFTRFVSMDIVDARTMNQDEPRKIYETRTTSIGSCGSLVDVFESLLRGMFDNWPGKSGVASSSRVRWAGRCAGQ